MTTNGKVYVNGLPRTATDRQLDGLCGQHGKVKSARVVLLYDETTGRQRGFGFIEMESQDDNRKVVAALNGSKLDGSTLQCFSISYSVID